MKASIKLIGFIVAMSGMANAASIVVSNLVDTNFTTFEDVALGASYTAKIGFLADGAVVNTGSTFDSIITSWSGAGDIAFASGDAAGYNGYFSGKAIFTDAAGLAGKNVFIWVTDGGFNNAILRADTLFLADSAIPNENAIGIESSNLGSFQLILGTINLEGSNAETGGSIVLNNAIPEPSTILLGGLGVFALARRRR